MTVRLRNCLAGLLLACAAAFGPTVPAFALEYIRNYAFVTTNSAEIVAIDMRHNRLAKRIRLKEIPKNLFVLEDLRLLLSMQEDGDAVEMFDLAQERLLAPIAVGHRIDFAQYHRQKNLLAVADAERGLITVIDPVSRKIVSKTSGIAQMTGLTFDPSGESLFVTTGRDEMIAVIDVATGGVSKWLLTEDAKRAEANHGLASLTRTPNGWIAVAMSKNKGQPASFVDMRHQAVLKRIDLGGTPSNRGYSTADGAFIIFPNDRDRHISIVSMASQSEVARLRGGSEMIGVNTGWFETIALITDRGTENVFVVDLVERNIAGYIRLPGRPGTPATAPDGMKAYIPLTDQDKIAVIDIRDRKLMGLIDGVGPGPRGIFTAATLSFCH